IAHLEDIAQVGELHGERLGRLFGTAVNLAGRTIVEGVINVVLSVDQVIRTGNDIRRRPPRSYRRLIDVANAGQIPAVVADIGHFQREVWGKRMLHTKGPVPHIGSGQVAVHAHDRTGTVETVNRLRREVAINRGGSIPRKTGKDGYVAGRDVSAGCISGRIDDRPGWHAGKAEAIVESDE